ncbi:hypothetical protein JCM8547_001017 [Rhodosporidiobolus lusitaniae]
MLQVQLVRPLRRAKQSLRAPSRSLWRASTLVSSSPTSLLSHLETSPPPLSFTACVYALSKNTPQDLVPSFRALLSRSDASTPAVGCLSEVLPPFSFPFPSSAAPCEGFSLALAYWEPTDSSEPRPVVFRSTLTGRPNISVGREHRPEDVEQDNGEDAGFEAFLRGEKWGFGSPATKNSENEGLGELQGVEPNQIKQIVAFAADRFQPFLSALSAYPSASAMGLVGSSTPFHSPTHDPFSLYLGTTETDSAGAIGVVIVGGNEVVTEKLSYGGLEPLGKPMEVTSSRGNIVLLLSQQNAAKTLLNEVNSLFGTSAQNLSAIQRSQEKEKEFYAAVFERDPGANPKLNEAKLVAKIMAGDPSRGAMSVETEEEVKQGSWLVFLHRPSSSNTAMMPSTSPNSLTFLSLAPSYTSPHITASECPTTGDVLVLDGFIAASENGIIHSAGQGRKAVCAIEGARVELSG